MDSQRRRSPARRGRFRAPHQGKLSGKPICLVLWKRVGGNCPFPPGILSRKLFD